MSESLHRMRGSSQRIEIVHVVLSVRRIAIGREEQSCLHGDRSRRGQREVDGLKVSGDAEDRSGLPARPLPRDRDTWSPQGGRGQSITSQ